MEKPTVFHGGLSQWLVILNSKSIALFLINSAEFKTSALVLVTVLSSNLKMFLVLAFSLHGYI